VQSVLPRLVLPHLLMRETAWQDPRVISIRGADVING